MLTLSLKGNKIPLTRDFSMRLTFKSPVCDFTKIPSSYALSMSFEINEYTRMLFGSPERYTKRRGTNSQKFPDFRIEIDGLLFLAGTLKVTSDGMSYEGTVIDHVGVLGEKEQERTLVDISRFAQQQQFVSKSKYLPEVDNYCCFPIQNTHFFKDKGYVIEAKRLVKDPKNANKQVTETYNTELMTHLFERTLRITNMQSEGSMVNNTNDARTAVNQFNSVIRLDDPLNQNDGIPGASKVSVISPFFFLNYVIKQALLDSEFYIKSNYLASHPALKNLCIYNTFDITNATFDTYTEPRRVYRRNTFEPAQQEVLSGVNQVNLEAVGKKVYQYKRTNPGNIIPKSHLPKMKVGEAILGIQNLFNICFHFLPNKTINVYSREQLLADEAIDINSYMTGTWKLGEQKTVALKFTREHDDKDLIISERYEDLSDRRDNIKEDVWDWDALTGLPSTPGDIRYIISTGQYVEYKWSSVTNDDPVTKKAQTIDLLGWKEISIGLQNGWYEYGREEVEEIKSMWSSPYSQYGKVTVEQPGNTGAWPAKTQAFGPRLMFNIPSSNLYGDSHYAGVNIPSEQEISMEYEKAGSGILDRFWKRWNPFWANRLPVTGMFNMPVNALRHVIYNICRKYRTDEGEFMISELSFDVYVDHISQVEIKGYKIE